jgi:hypothetical protein
MSRSLTQCAAMCLILTVISEEYGYSRGFHPGCDGCGCGVRTVLLQLTSSRPLCPQSHSPHLQWEVPSSEFLRPQEPRLHRRCGLWLHDSCWPRLSPVPPHRSARHALYSWCVIYSKLHPNHSFAYRRNIFPLDSPRVGFPTLNLAAPMAEYTYGSSYTNGSPGHPFNPPHGAYPAALMSSSAGEIFSDGTSGRTSRGSGSHSPNLFSVPHFVHYNPSVCPPWGARVVNARAVRASMTTSPTITTTLPP